MVGADLQSLISAHHQSSLSVLLVLQKSNVTGTTFLPLICVLDELEQLCTHLEGLLLQLLVGLDINLLGETNNGFEVDVLGLWCFILT